MMEDLKGYKTTVLGTVFRVYEPQLVVDSGSAIYGLIGLTMGSLLAQLVLSGIARLRRSAAPARRPAS